MEENKKKKFKVNKFEKVVNKIKNTNQANFAMIRKTSKGRRKSIREKNNSLKRKYQLF